MAMHPILVLTNPYGTMNIVHLLVQRDYPILYAYVKIHCIYLLVKII
jgi:hypothetical protein